MKAAWLRMFAPRVRGPIETPPAQRVYVDLSSPASTLRSMAHAYINGDAAAVLECVELNDSSWPRGRVQGWATFVDAAGRLRRAADAAFGPGSGDQLVAELLKSDPGSQGRRLLDLLDAGAHAHLADGDATAPTPAPESFVLGPTWLVRTRAGWKLTGGPAHRPLPDGIDPALLREAMDHSDQLVVADAETAYYLADEIESGRVGSMNRARSVGQKQRKRVRDRAGWNDRKFSKRLLQAADRVRR